MRGKNVKGLGYYLFLFGGITGLCLLFLLNFIYIFLAIGLTVLGLIALPSVLLGLMGVITVITDLPMLPLLLISSGILLLGSGMCMGAASLCPGSLNLLHRFTVALGYRRKRAEDE